MELEAWGILLVGALAGWLIRGVVTTHWLMTLTATHEWVCTHCGKKLRDVFTLPLKTGGE